MESEAEVRTVQGACLCGEGREASGTVGGRKLFQILAINAKRRGWLATASCVNLRGQPVRTGWPH